MECILLDFLIKIFSSCNMYVCPLNKLSPFTVDVRFYLQIQYWEQNECGKDMNNLAAVPWPSGFSLRTSHCSLVIRLAENTHGSAHVQQNNTKACFSFFLTLYSQRMSSVFLSLDKAKTLLLWNQSSSSKYRLGEMWSHPSLSGLSTSGMTVNNYPLLCGQWLSVPPVNTQTD